MESEEREYLFVYGLLLDKFENYFSSLLYHNSNYLGEGTTSGKLYDIGAYPGLIHPDEEVQKVKGRIYELTDPKILVELDHFEGIGENHLTPHEYVREKKKVLFGQEHLNCWVYIYNWPIEGYQVIESGDYREYMAQKV